MKTRPGVDCGSEPEFLIAKFRLKLKKIGKTTGPFRYDLNQIPCDYAGEVTDRFKGLYLVDRVSEGLWRKVYSIVNEAMTKTIPPKKKYKKAKWLSEEALQIAEERYFYLFILQGRLLLLVFPESLAGSLLPSCFWNVA